MPFSPQRRSLSLTNADQTVTKVDARLTKVDKTYHRQPPLQPQTPATRGAIAPAPAIQTPPASTLAVNPSAIPAPRSGAPRTTLNKSEQTRTSPNAPTR